MLTHGTYNSSFLLEVARKMDAAERGRARSDTHLRHPMADVMEALSKNPQAAQDFFNAGDTLKYYVTAHTLNDGGKALGKALEAATITFRDHAGSESHPSPGYISAKLASHLVHYEYERIKSGKLAKSPVDPLSLGRIMAAYTPDITRVATLPGIEKPGVYMEDNAGNIAKIDLAGEMDEMQQRHVKAFMAVINTGLAFPQRASWPIGATILSSWTGMIEDSFKGTARREAIFAANTTAEQTRFLLHQLAAQAMLDHGLYGSRGEPSRSHPWAWLHSRNPDQDPLKSSNNFLDEDGRLMTPEQMRQGSGERLNAYQAWLYREPQGNPMKDLGILSQLNEGFTLGISIYK